VVETVDLRELCRNASELVRRVESGAELIITVAGRPSVRMVPVTPLSATPRRWRTYAEIEELWSGSAPENWAADCDLIDQRPRDPWAE
jgi:prevent-host-death family protein